MPQIFPSAFNPLGKLAVVAAPILFGATGITGAMLYRSSYFTGRYETVSQPVQFSHLHHVGQLGIDCRYCHTSVEESGFANVPPTKTCMNCHQQMWVGAGVADAGYPGLNLVRESYKSGESVQWNRVHNVPHYAYFNHSIHVAKGVGCTECHGRIDQMHQVYQTQTLLMEWCLSCHKNPEPHLRPKSEVTSMTWTPETPTTNPKTGELYPTKQSELGKMLKEEYQIRDRMVLTNCSMCHR
jgi:hypothetical protein